MRFRKSFKNNLRNKLTAFCIIIARWSLMDRTISRGYTGWLASIRHKAVSMRTRTPVRPIPAEQWTTAGSTMPVRADRTHSVNVVNCRQSLGTPWSGQPQYCMCVMCLSSSHWKNVTGLIDDSKMNQTTYKNSFSKLLKYRSKKLFKRFKNWHKRPCKLSKKLFLRFNYNFFLEVSLQAFQKARQKFWQSSRKKSEHLTKLTLTSRSINSRKTKVSSIFSEVDVSVRFHSVRVSFSAGQYWWHLVRPRSTSVVSMTTRVLPASRTICQKSATVDDSGPCVAM